MFVKRFNSCILKSNCFILQLLFLSGSKKVISKKKKKKKKKKEYTSESLREYLALSELNYFKDQLIHVTAIVLFTEKQTSLPGTFYI